MKTSTFSILTLVLTIVLSGCATPKGDNSAEKRTYVRDMRDDVMKDLYRFKPELREEIKKAPGYAAFNNVNLKIFVLGTGHGYGLAVDNETGKETYMRMGELGAGLGLGVKDLRVVFVFKDKSAYRSFVDKGWEFGGEADATAIAGGDKGVSASAQASAGGNRAAVSGEGKSGIGGKNPGVQGSSGAGFDVYQLTENGLALQAMISGTKYWKDRKLNP